jgi:Ca-activated chloride channel family protein
MDLASLEAFHFLRPLWLLAIPLLVLTGWAVRRSTRPRERAPLNLAPHLLSALSVHGEERRRLQPVDGVVIGTILAALAAAGPTWSRVPNPLLADTAPMAVVLEVSETMLAVDIQPTRLERAKQKIRDLLELRAGAPTALIAYAGTAHRVLPLTEDPEILRTFLEGLVPDVMPREGQNASRALEVATGTLSQEASPGIVLFVTDGFDSADIPAFEASKQASGPVTMALVVGTEQGGPIKTRSGGYVSGPDGQRQIDRVDFGVLDRLSALAGTIVIRVSLDRSDLGRIDRKSQALVRDVASRDESADWEDRGWLLMWPAAALGLAWFRRGWTMRWTPAALPLLSILTFAESAHAEGLVDRFFTPDQQGRYAYERLRFSEAGDLFEDPTWKGTALYEAGRYQEAADAFGRVTGPDALFAMGNALVKGRQYGRAIKAYEQALAEAPDHEGARTNLGIAEAIRANVTRLREEEDHGEQPDLGADGYEFDNEESAGVTVAIDAQADLTADSEATWMRTVDPGTAEFLRFRFQLEADQEGAP